MADDGNAIAKALRRQGVNYLFALCGGHIAPILVGANRSGIKVIEDVTHPESPCWSTRS
nr:hypothetical protein [Candidatus Sigynarchaeum springense]